MATPPATQGTTVADGRLTFTAPLPGLGQDRQFTLTALDDAGLIYAMRSVDDPDVRLFVVPPQPFFTDYAPGLEDSTLAMLDTTAASAALLVVVTPAADGSGHTANLLAPIVVNLATGAAAQVVLDGSTWPLRAPLGG